MEGGGWVEGEMEGSGGMVGGGGIEGGGAMDGKRPTEGSMTTEVEGSCPQSKSVHTAPV